MCRDLYVRNKIKSDQLRSLSPVALRCVDGWMEREQISNNSSGLPYLYVIHVQSRAQRYYRSTVCCGWIGWMDGICFGCSSNLGVIINYVGGVIIISRSTATQHLQHHHVHAGWDFGVIADRREFISLTFKISYPNLEAVCCCCCSTRPFFLLCESLTCRS